MKVYNIMHNVGYAKHVVNFHNGNKKHKDGSKFFDIAIFANKKNMAKFINTLKRDGYKEE